jgi:hypothetical protein
MIDDDECGAVAGMRIGMGNRITRRKPAPVHTLSSTNLTWPDLGSNPGHRGGNPVTNRLSYGTDEEVIQTPRKITKFEKRKVLRSE